MRRAQAYVDLHGDPLDCARAAALAGTGPIDAVIERLVPQQRDDGAVAAAGVSGVAGSLFALGVVDDLRSLKAPLVERMCFYLASAQRDDGSWAGDEEDSIDARLYVTGMLAGHLAKTRWTRPRLLAAAGDVLARHWSPDRVKGNNWRGIVAHAHCFANVQHDFGDEVLQWCGRELERGFRSKCWGAVQTARVLVHCDAHAIPGGQVAAAELLQAIEVEQQSDGGWIDLADPSSDARVVRTLDAMAAIVHFTGPS
jgi:hypothetical protein